MPIRFAQTFVAIALIAVCLDACGGTSDESATAGRDEPPTVTVPAGPPPTEVVIEDLAVGEGAAIPPSSNPPKVEIETLYKAVDYQTGKPYEEQWDPNHPLQLAFGPGREIKGWEEGLVGMRVGGRRELIVPSELANGDGAVVYVIDLVGLRKLPPPRPPTEEPAKAKKPARKGRLEMTKAEISSLPPLEIRQRSGPPPKKLIVNDLREGFGARVTPEDAVRVNFFYVRYREALKAPRSGKFGPTKYGMNEVVKAWELGLPGMKVGGRRELVAPPNLVYNKGPVIYVIDLLGLIPGGAGSF